MGVSYSASLLTNTTALSGEELRFAKLSGPAWLSVAVNGTLSGTPAATDNGINLFSVSLSDTNGLTSSAIMTINVVPLPTVWITRLGTKVILNWDGGQTPNVVQIADNLLKPNWQDLGFPSTNRSLLIKPSNAAAYYRIRMR